MYRQRRGCGFALAANPHPPAYYRAMNAGTNEKWFSHLCAALLVACAMPLTGCPPSDGGGSAGVELRFDDGDPILVDSGSPVTRVAPFDITADLPSNRVGSIDVTLAADDVDAITVGETGAVLRISLTVASQQATDACSSGVEVAAFDVDLQSTGASSVTPDTVRVASNGLATMLAGQFQGCLTVSSDVPATLVVRRFQLAFIDPPPITFDSCDDVLALDAVGAALDRLSSNELPIRFPAGDDLIANLDGAYDLTQETTFDPDGANVGDAEDGSVTLSALGGGGFRRSGFEGFVDFLTTASTGTIGFCTIERTNNPACDQTVARLESLVVDPETGALNGRFLAVSVRRERFTDPQCGDDGDFIFGDLTLTPIINDTLLAAPVRVDFADEFEPDLLLVSPTGQQGVVTDRVSDTALQFTTTSPATITQIALPQALQGAAGFSALGVSTDGLRLAVVTDQPDASAAYDFATLDLVRQTAPIDADYIGGRVDFSPDASRIFVPTTDPRFADRVTVLRTDDSPFGDEIRRLLTPQGRVPVQARVSRDGLRLAELLEAGAPIGLAGELVFVSAQQDTFLSRINLANEAGGTVLANKLVNSLDGSRVFLAGVGAVIAVQAQQPFAIDRIDVSGGAGDDPTGLALSGDGAILAVSVAANNGEIDLAIIDANQLTVLQTFDLEAIDPGEAVDVAHFASARIAVVMADTDQVVAVQTQEPFAEGDPVNVADSPGQLLGTITAGGDVIAVTNIDEPTVYLLTPASRN